MQHKLGKILHISVLCVINSSLEVYNLILNQALSLVMEFAIPIHLDIMQKRSSEPAAHRDEYLVRK